MLDHQRCTGSPSRQLGVSRMGAMRCGAKGFLCQLWARRLSRSRFNALWASTTRDVTTTTLYTAVRVRPVARGRVYASAASHDASRFRRTGGTHPLLVSADDIRRVVGTEAGGRSLRQTAARITAKAEPLKPALEAVSSCLSVDTVHLFPPL